MHPQSLAVWQFGFSISDSDVQTPDMRRTKKSQFYTSSVSSIFQKVCQITIPTNRDIVMSRRAVTPTSGMQINAGASSCRKRAHIHTSRVHMRRSERSTERSIQGQVQDRPRSKSNMCKHPGGYEFTVRLICSFLVIYSVYIDISLEIQ